MGGGAAVRACGIGFGPAARLPLTVFFAPHLHADSEFHLVGSGGQFDRVGGDARHLVARDGISAFERLLVIRTRPVKESERALLVADDANERKGIGRFLSRRGLNPPSPARAIRIENIPVSNNSEARKIGFSRGASRARRSVASPVLGRVLCGVPVLGAARAGCP